MNSRDCEGLEECAFLMGGAAVRALEDGRRSGRTAVSMGRRLVGAAAAGARCVRSFCRREASGLRSLPSTYRKLTYCREKVFLTTAHWSRGPSCVLWKCTAAQTAHTGSKSREWSSELPPSGLCPPVASPNKVTLLGILLCLFPPKGSRLIRWICSFGSLIFCWM